MPARPSPQGAYKKKKRKLPLKTALFFFAVSLLIFTVVPRLKPDDMPESGTQTKFNKKQYSLNDPTSIWVIVNKGRILPADYTPRDLMAPNVPLRLSSSDSEMQLRSIAAPSLQRMFGDASKENIHLMISSAYRSYGLQKTVYSNNISAEGQQGADSLSAKPGHSEHQTGLAVDIEPASRACEVEVCFADTAEGKWLAANSYKYGFIIRYPANKEQLTGYEYEPWHVRYIGEDSANQINITKQTLEQFFGLPLTTDYVANPYQLKQGL
jgi:D-alanyl-D-alanine carboxypeptidase